MPDTHDRVLAIGQLSPLALSRITPNKYRAIAPRAIDSQRISMSQTVTQALGVNSGGNGSPVRSSAGVGGTNSFGFSGSAVVASAVPRPMAEPMMNSSTATSRQNPAGEAEILERAPRR